MCVICNPAMEILASFYKLYVIFSVLTFAGISAHEGEQKDPTIKIMEDFSGYPVHEPNSVSSLYVDTHSLQNQIDELSTFSDSPAPSVTRVLYSEKDVLARRQGSVCFIVGQAS